MLSSCSSFRVQTVEEETEANHILVVLNEYGINATKFEAADGEEKVYEIYVDGQEEYATALRLLRDHCLPQKLPPPIESSGLVSSLEVETAQELRRMKIDIASLLRNLPGTTCVDVSIVMPEDQSLNLEPYKASATVLIKHKTEKYGLGVDEIAQMVSGAVPGLSPNKVVVSLTKQPLEAAPDFSRGRNMRRILYVSIIGISTILLFVGFVVLLRKRGKKGDSELSDEDELLDDGDDTELLDDNSVTDANDLNN